MQIVRPYLTMVDSFNGHVNYVIDSKDYSINLDYIEDPYRDFAIDLDLFNILLKMDYESIEDILLNIDCEIKFKTLELFLNIVLKELAGFRLVVKLKLYFSSEYIVSEIKFIGEDLRLEEKIPFESLKSIKHHYYSVSRYVLSLWPEKLKSRLKEILEQ